MENKESIRQRSEKKIAHALKQIKNASDNGLRDDWYHYAWDIIRQTLDNGEAMVIKLEKNENYAKRFLLWLNQSGYDHFMHTEQPKRRIMVIEDENYYKCYMLNDDREDWEAEAFEKVFKAAGARDSHEIAKEIRSTTII